METKNVLQEVTAKLLGLLDKVSSGDIVYWIPLSGLAYNPFTDHQYSSLNQLLLSYEMYQRNYSHNNWLTFKQIHKAGGSVLKDEKSCMVTFTDVSYHDRDGNPLTPQAAKTAFQTAKAANPSIATYSEVGITTKRFLKIYQVFNVAQTSGLPDSLIKPQFDGLTQKERHELAESLIRDSGAVIVHVSANSAHYDQLHDKIQVPFSEQFKNSENYYSTLFHEVIHWTGHKSRLNRPFGKKKSPEYAFEELVAELGSAFLCAEMGIPAPLKSSAAYIKSWLTALENDRNYLLKAVSQAEKAVLYLVKKQSIGV